MHKAIAINGSPHRDKGNTGMILVPLIEGMRDAGWEVEEVYARDLKISGCNCKDMYCWYQRPGVCCHDDDMTPVLSRIREADILILATPVYVPLPGEMQDVINRLCPLLIPKLVFRDGRTRAEFRQGIKVKKILLVSTGGWWERGNFGTVIRIVQEIAENTSVEFAGAVVRPHAQMMWPEGQLTEDGKVIVNAARSAGQELARNGAIRAETLEEISRPLIGEEELRAVFNDWARA